jgi:hypothetical protein
VGQKWESLGDAFKRGECHDFLLNFRKVKSEVAYGVCGLIAHFAEEIKVLIILTGNEAVGKGKFDFGCQRGKRNVTIEKIVDELVRQ